jgi:hypothetical protein
MPSAQSNFFIYSALSRNVVSLGGNKTWVAYCGYWIELQFALILIYVRCLDYYYPRCLSLYYKVYILEMPVLGLLRRGWSCIKKALIHSFIELPLLRVTIIDFILPNILSHIPRVVWYVWLITLHGFGLDTGFIHYGDYNCSRLQLLTADTTHN